MKREDLLKIQHEFEKKDCNEIIEWAQEYFRDKIAFASSFGAEDVVLIDLLLKHKPAVSIFTIDTGRLPQETYDLWEKIEEKYAIKIRTYFPEQEDVETLVTEYGPNLFYHNLEQRKLCCHIRKVKPLARALAGLAAWITGLRREQSVARFNIKSIEFDHANKLIKINPLYAWKQQEVWEYIRENNVPYNKLHDQNYLSIGCAPCTRAVAAGEDIRAGRWWWEESCKKECGLHQQSFF